jgi:hypothetical protein
VSWIDFNIFRDDSSSESVCGSQKHVKLNLVTTPVYFYSFLLRLDLDRSFVLVAFDEATPQLENCVLFLNRAYCLLFTLLL